VKVCSPLASPASSTRKRESSFVKSMSLTYKRCDTYKSHVYHLARQVASHLMCPRAACWLRVRLLQRPRKSCPFDWRTLRVIQNHEGQYICIYIVSVSIVTYRYPASTKHLTYADILSCAKSSGHLSINTLASRIESTCEGISFT
jgi:hypothetical protein